MDPVSTHEKPPIAKEDAADPLSTHEKPPIAEEDAVGDSELDDAIAWIEVMNGAFGGKMMIPPLHMIYHTDLLNDAGWTRLVPYTAGFVDWSEFKKYLEAYLKQDAVSTPGVEQNTELIAAANLCLENENMLLRNCFGDLDTDDIKLVIKIKDQAKEIIKSEGQQYIIARVGLECIAAEAKLISNLVDCKFDSTEMIAISNQIRRSALNLMLSGSAAAAGAMAGLVKEANILVDLLNRPDYLVFVQYNTCDTIREKTATVLTMLEQEIACETDAANNTSDNHMGLSGVGDMDGHCVNNLMVETQKMNL